MKWQDLDKQLQSQNFVYSSTLSSSPSSQLEIIIQLF